MDFEDLTFEKARAGLLSKEWTCRELVQHHLEKINEGTHLNAFISVLGERALAKAEAIDTRAQSRHVGRLAGVVLAVKDNIALEGAPLTCGSRILENFVSPYDATVVRRLEAEDAIILGKTNMDEFAMGSSNENSHFGPVSNPHVDDRVPGGSSGGSCAAVAQGMVMAALGSDTGGSIRQPASFCGVVGLKPTYGRVSRFGLVAFASSLDQIGPITRTVEEAGIVLQTIAGHDKRDSTSAPRDVDDLACAPTADFHGLRVGLPVEYFTDALEPEVRDAISRVSAIVESAGGKLVEVSLPHTEYAIATYYILATAEASSNLARYDAVRYGFRAEDAADLDEMYVRSRSLAFGEEVQRRIMLGTYVLSAGYYEAYYRKAQKVRTLILKDFERAFEGCDCLLAPTAPTTAFGIGQKVDDPLNMYLSDIYTVSANLAGLPAISVPCGSDGDGLPIGVQVIAKHFDERTILRMGRLVEQIQK